MSRGGLGGGSRERLGENIIHPSMAQQLADWGLVSGLIFNDTKDDGTFCESCIYGKVMCRLIVKAC